VDTFNDDDQVARIKAWWKQYGKSLITGAVIGLLLLGGLNYWKQYRQQRAEAASRVYDMLLNDIQLGKTDDVMSIASQLMRDYSGTPYAGKAALYAARIRFDARDIPGARQHLEWAVRHASEPGVYHSARLRLGRLMLDQGETDAALKLIEGGGVDGFAAEYEELRGDLLLAKGDRDGARRAYRKAMESLTPGSPYQRILGMKLDNLGPDAQL